MNHQRFILTVALITVCYTYSNLLRGKAPIYSNNKIAINGFDVVAYFTNNKATPGNSIYSYHWQGVEWLFSSQQHKDLFVHSPERYQPLFGGFCGLGAAHGALVPADPNAWTIHKGQLILNQDKEVSETWRYNPDINIKRAKSSYSKAISRYKKWHSKSSAQPTTNPQAKIKEKK